MEVKKFVWLCIGVIYGSRVVEVKKYFQTFPCEGLRLIADKVGRLEVLASCWGKLSELLSKLLVSPLITPIVVPYIIPP